MGFTKHFYIIFGTNLLTEGPVQIAVFFAYFSVSQKKNIKRNETFGSVISGTNVIQRTWSGRQERSEEATRQEGAPRGARRVPTLMGPTELHRRNSFTYIYSYTLKTSGGATKPCFQRRNLLYPWDPILGPFLALRRRGNRSRRASTSTPWPLRWCVSSLPQTFRSIVIS